MDTEKIPQSANPPLRMIVWARAHSLSAFLVLTFQFSGSFFLAVFLVQSQTLKYILNMVGVV
jgi:hypothetical protein